MLLNITTLNNIVYEIIEQKKTTKIQSKLKATQKTKTFEEKQKERKTSIIEETF